MQVVIESHVWTKRTRKFWSVNLGTRWRSGASPTHSLHPRWKSLFRPWVWWWICTTDVLRWEQNSKSGIRPSNNLRFMRERCCSGDSHQVKSITCCPFEDECVRDPLRAVMHRLTIISPRVGILQRIATHDWCDYSYAAFYTAVYTLRIKKGSWFGDSKCSMDGLIKINWFTIFPKNPTVF